MNAIISANTLQWKESSAFNKEFQMDCLDVRNVMSFNTQVTYDQTFKEEVRADLPAVLTKFGLGSLNGAALDIGWEKRLHLTDEEFQAIDELTTVLMGRGIKANMALERVTASAGVGVPAIAIVILVLVVVVVVYGF